MDQNLSRSQFPPGGWEFYQPQTRWSAPTPKSSTFDQTVVLIIKHRLANPAMVVRYGLKTDAGSVGAELEAYTRVRLGMAPATPPGGAAVPKMQAPIAVPQLSGPVQQAVAVVKKMAAGASLLLEWEESGMPAEPAEVAAARAFICSDCPKNDKGKSITEYFTVPAADNIHKRFQKLFAMNLTTPHDAALNVCQACLCPLKLKVHTPMILIQKRLKPEQRAELDPRCWILK